MSERFTIRMATIADAPLIVTQRRKMFEDMGHTDTHVLDTMDVGALEWIQEKLQNGRYIGWFVLNEHGQEIAGAGLWLMEWIPGVFDPSSLRGYVLNVYVAPDYRRRGLARQLMQAILSWCQSSSIRTVTLHASDEGKWVYQGLGFTFTNEMRLLLQPQNS